jgi:hypothetical protein
MDLGVGMIGNALGSVPNSGPDAHVTCKAYNNALALCSSWAQALMCSAYPWSDVLGYKCAFE